MDDNQQPEQAVSDTTVMATTRKKRVITASRKEQNKLAQKAYRERQREKRKMQRLLVPSLPRRLAPRIDNAKGTRLPTSSSGLRGEPTLCNSSPVNSVADSESPVSPDPGSGNLQAESSQVAVSQFPPSRMASVTVFNTITSGDPGMNTTTTSIPSSIEANATSIMRACLTNAIYIGADINKLMTCAKPCTSPFYRPISNLDEAEALITTPHNSIPDSLRPTPAQILIPHHASLDLIPLPRLRERAILLCAALPHLFSLWDMKLDIYVRDALVCQGANSQSWDARTWQAAPWFKRKWKLVVDADEVKTSPAVPGIPGLWMH